MQLPIKPLQPTVTMQKTDTTPATTLTKIPKAVTQSVPNTYITTQNTKSRVKPKTRGNSAYIYVIIGVVLVTMIALGVYYHKKNTVESYNFLDPAQAKCQYI